MFWWLSFLLVVISIGACIYYEIQTSSKKKEDKVTEVGMEALTKNLGDISLKTESLFRLLLKPDKNKKLLSKEEREQLIKSLEERAENIRIIDELSKQKEVAKQNIFRSLEKEREKSGLKPGEAQIILDKSKNNEEIVGESMNK